MENILLTGSKGFIGNHITKKLVEKDIKFIEFNEDINIAENFEAYKNCEISRVLHIAGKTVVSESWKEPAKYYLNNTYGTMNVLEFCRKKNIPLTYVSAYIYGIPDKIPITEETKPIPNNPYAHSKYLAEQLCEFYYDSYGVNVTIIRPFNVYGKGQSKDFLIPMVIEQVLNKDFITIKDLIPKRDYIYVEDLAEALISTFSYSEKFSVFNVASGKSYSVKEIIDIIQNIAGTNKDVISENIIRKNEINNIEVDITKAVDKLGWCPYTSIEQGISEILKDKEVAL
jgi:nucleoside-diphosphate-sugar epimerase